MKLKELIPILLISIILLSMTVIREMGNTLVSPPWNHCLGINKITQFHLNLCTGFRETFDNPQGLFCIKLESEDNPDTEKDDDELTVFGLNSGRHRIIYNKGLTSIGIVGEFGSGPLQFNNPQSVAADRHGNLFVCDTGNNRLVHLIYTDGELIFNKEIRVPGIIPLSNPSGIALSGGRLYVADTGNDRIVVMGTNGAVIDTLSLLSDGVKLEGPSHIAVVSKADDHLYYSDYFIAVVDSLGQRLWKVRHGGKVVGLTRYSELGGTGSFNHVAIDYYGNIYTTDSRNNRIHKFDRHLNYIVGVGGEGTKGDQFDEPRGITIYRRFGQVFVSERAGAQYYWIGTDILRFSGCSLILDADKNVLSINVSFLLTEHSTFSLFLDDEKGKRHFTVVADYLLPGGKFNKTIQVPCEIIEELAKCKLYIVATAQPTYSSNAFLTVVIKSTLLQPTLKSLASSSLRNN